jgi:hypothetical protein
MLQSLLLCGDNDVMGEMKINFWGSAYETWSLAERVCITEFWLVLVFLVIVERQTTMEGTIKCGWLVVRSPAVVNALNGQGERTRSCEVDDADAVPLENIVPLDAQCEAAMWEDRGEWVEMFVNNPDLRLLSRAVLELSKICRSWRRNTINADGTYLKSFPSNEPSKLGKDSRRDW